MKPISTPFAAHIAGEVTTLAMCWKVARRDAMVQGFTDHDRDIVFDSVSYVASSGFAPSAVVGRSDFSVDNLEVEGVLAAESITEADIMAGVYDYAEIAVFLLNYNDITQGPLMLRRGWMGEVSLKAGQFVAEMRGLSQALAQNIGQLYSPACRATLGDARCRVDLSGFTVAGTITAITLGGLGFVDSIRPEAAGYFTNGTLTFTAGANSGFSMEIKDYARLGGGAGGAFTLALPLPYPLSAGDAYTAIAGCDKTTGMCAVRFSNILNFRGEPRVPGLDRMLQTAGTR